MGPTIVYDHFIAKGGAENVSLQMASHFPDSTLLTAFADPTLFESEINRNLLRVASRYLNTNNSTSAKLVYFFLLKFKLPLDAPAILSGLYAPLSLIRGKTSQKRIVYFHMFPTFLLWSFGYLRKQYGLILGTANWFFIIVYRFLLRMATNKADTVFCNSRITQQQFASVGINAELLNPPVFLNGLAYEADDGYFLSTARLEESKRVQVIAEAFTRLPDSKIVFAGGGSLLEKMKEDYAQYSNIKFLGWLDSEELKKYYNRCKCLIYIPEKEAFGIASIEAMASGKPVLGVNEGGLIETITDERLGTLLPTPITVEALTSCISKIALKTAGSDDIEYRVDMSRKYDAENFFLVLSNVLSV